MELKLFHPHSRSGSDFSLRTDYKTGNRCSRNSAHKDCLGVVDRDSDSLQGNGNFQDIC